MAVIQFRFNPSDKETKENPRAYREDYYDPGTDEGASGDPSNDSSYDDDWDYADYEDDNFDSYVQQRLDAYEKTGHPARRKNLLRPIGIAVLTASVILFGILQFQGRSYTRSTITKLANIDALDAATYRNLDGNILAYSRDGANCMDETGKKLWNLTFEMQQPIIDVSGSVAAIGDYNGSTIYVVSKDRTMETIDTNMPIRALCVSARGDVAAVLDDTGVTWVYLYDGTDGEVNAYFKTTMKQSGYPLGVSVSPNGELVCVSYLLSENSKIKTSIAFYNFGDVGQNALENNVSAFNFEEEVFPYVNFMNSDTMIAVSDSRIAFFKGSQIPQNGANSLFQDNLVGVYCGDQYVGLLFPDTTGQYQYELQIYSAAGERVGSIPFSMDYTNIQIIKDRVIINDDVNCLIYSASGKLRFEGSFDARVRVVIPSETASRLTLVTESAIERMVLQ